MNKPAFCLRQHLILLTSTDPVTQLLCWPAGLLALSSFFFLFDLPQSVSPQSLLDGMTWLLEVKLSKRTSFVFALSHF